MTTATTAKLRLLKDSIQQKKLAELKEVAAELEIQSTQVKNYGSLSLKASWLEAINAKIAELFEGGQANHSDNLSPEELEGSLVNSLTEVSMSAPDSENFVETPIPASVPLEFPEEPEEELPWMDGIKEDPLPACPDCHKYPDAMCPTCYDLGQIIPGYKEGLLSGGKSNYQWFVKAIADDGYTQTDYPYKPCKTCDGTGLVSGEICQDCNGTGFDHYKKDEPSTEPDLSFSRVLLEGFGVNLPEFETIPFDGDEDWVPCPECDGVGFIGFNHDEICHHCYGEGLIPPNGNHLTSPLDLGKSSRQIALEINTAFDGIHTVGQPCETCLGTGLVPDFNGDGDEICPDCEGTGYEKSYTAPETPPTIPPDDFQASNFEKETLVKFLESEGVDPASIEALKSEPLSKLDAAMCLGLAENSKRKSAEITLRLYLVDWVNDLAGDAERCFSRAEQMNILFTWKFITEVKTKLAHHFQLRDGEINCFLTPDGYRVSVPNWTKEQILTPQETEFITADDPTVQLFGNGYLHAIAHFEKQVTLHSVELSL